MIERVKKSRCCAAVWLRTAINQRLALNRSPFDNYKVNHLSNRPSKRVMVGSVTFLAQFDSQPSLPTGQGQGKGN